MHGCISPISRRCLAGTPRWSRMLSGNVADLYVVRQ